MALSRTPETASKTQCLTIYVTNDTWGQSAHASLYLLTRLVGQDLVDYALLREDGAA